MGGSANQRRSACWNDFGDTRFSTRAAAHFYGNGARRLAAAVLCSNSSTLPHAIRDNNLDRSGRWRSGHAGRHRLTLRFDEHWNIVRIHSRLRRRGRFAANRRWASAAVSCPTRAAVSDRRRASVFRAHAQPAGAHLDPFLCLARNWSADLFSLQRSTQQTAPRYRHRYNGSYYTTDNQDVIVRVLTGTHPTKAAVSRRFL